MLYSDTSLSNLSIPGWYCGISVPVCKKNVKDKRADSELWMTKLFNHQEQEQRTCHLWFLLWCSKMYHYLFIPAELTEHTGLSSATPRFSPTQPHTLTARALSYTTTTVDLSSWRSGQCSLSLRAITTTVSVRGGRSVTHSLPPVRLFLLRKRRRSRSVMTQLLALFTLWVVMM